MVDDEEVLLVVAKVFLERSGDMKVDTVQSAAEAMRKLDHASYDVIVADYEMPKMDGITFLKAVRARYPSIPFGIFTGKGREWVVIEALNSGADFYLKKGGDPKAEFAELMHKIRRAVERKNTLEQLKGIQERMEFAETILESLQIPLFVVNESMQLVKANRAFYQSFDTSAEDAEGEVIFDIGDGVWNIPELRELLESILIDEVECQAADITSSIEGVNRTMRLNGCELEQDPGKDRCVLVAVQKMPSS
jgi:CheY-like chemotaxis protein